MSYKFYLTCSKFESNLNIPLCIPKFNKTIYDAYSIINYLYNIDNLYREKPYILITEPSDNYYIARTDINNENPLPKQIQRIPDKLLITHNYPYFYQYQLKYNVYAASSDVIDDSLEILDENGINITKTIDYTIEYALNSQIYQGYSTLDSLNNIIEHREDPIIFYEGFDLHPTSECSITSGTVNPYKKIQDLTSNSNYSIQRVLRNGYGLKYAGATADGPVFTYYINRSNISKFTIEFFVHLTSGWENEMGDDIDPAPDVSYFTIKDNSNDVIIDNVTFWKSNDYVRLHVAIENKRFLCEYRYALSPALYDGHHKIIFSYNVDQDDFKAQIDGHEFNVTSLGSAPSLLDFNKLIINTKQNCTHHIIDDLLIYVDTFENTSYFRNNIYDYHDHHFSNTRYNPAQIWINTPPSNEYNMYRIRLLLTYQDAQRELYVRYKKALLKPGNDVWIQDSHIESINPRYIYKETDISGQIFDYKLIASLSEPYIKSDAGNALYTYIKYYHEQNSTYPQLYAILNPDKKLDVYIDQIQDLQYGYSILINEGSYLENINGEYREFRNNDYYNTFHIYDNAKKEIIKPRCLYKKFQPAYFLNNKVIMIYDNNLRFRYMYEGREYPFYYIAHTSDNLFDLDYNGNIYTRYIFPSNIFESYPYIKKLQNQELDLSYYPEFNLGLNIYINSTLLPNYHIYDINENAGKIFLDIDLDQDSNIEVTYAIENHKTHAYSFNLNRAYNNSITNPISIYLNYNTPSNINRFNLGWILFGTEPSGQYLVKTYNLYDFNVYSNSKLCCNIFLNKILPNEIEDMRRRGGGLREDEFFEKPLIDIDSEIYSYLDIGNLYPFPYTTVGLIRLNELYENMAKNTLKKQCPELTDDEIHKTYVNIVNKTIYDFNAFGTFYVVTNASNEYLTSIIKILKKED
ncbi:MAG: hypothetical protein ACTSWR_08280 [Candidatus Helarchaeota archaeon]